MTTTTSVRGAAGRKRLMPSTAGESTKAKTQAMMTMRMMSLK